MRLLVVVAVSCGAAACSSRAPQQPTTAREGVLAAAEQAKAAGYTTQYEILRDGVVTDAELRQAWVDYTECATRQGLEVEPLSRMAGPFGYEYITAFEPGTGQTPHEAAVISDACQNRYQLTVDRGWDAQRGGALEPAYRASLAECLSAAGYEVPDTAETYEDFQAVAAGNDVDFSRCIESMLDTVDPSQAPGPSEPTGGGGLSGG